MKIYCPTFDFQGVRAGVSFVEGIGETDDPVKILWFKEHGYYVPDPEPTSKKKSEPKVEVKTDENTCFYGDKNLDIMTLEELKEFSKEIGRGRGLNVLKTREQVIRHIKK